MKHTLEETLMTLSNKENQFTSCVWPYDPDAAKTIECYVVKANRAKLYVWKQTKARYWQYTMSAGSNSERNMSGSIPIAPSLLGVQGAVDAAIAYCKQYRIWER